MRKKRMNHLAYAIICSILAVIYTVIGAAGGKTETLLIGICLVLWAVVEWIIFAVKRSEKKARNRSTYPTKKINAAEALSIHEAGQLKRRNQYLANPVPMQIRQWDEAAGWDNRNKVTALKKSVCIRKAGIKSMECVPLTEECDGYCTITKKDGAWYVTVTAADVVVRVNIPSGREKCEGMPVNDFFDVVSTPGGATVIVPCDCIQVCHGECKAYFRIDMR